MSGGERDPGDNRAYRIGQKRAVQVHKLLCAGTVEEKVDQMLEKKRRIEQRPMFTDPKVPSAV